ncbi:peptidylprolyl isomerase, partial [Candidatus Acetothermia bacterium]|nr:peptidylprolyl isomerase [Candidatus Acetothermia bacterium]
MSDLLKWVIIGLGLVLLVSLLTNKEPSKKPPSKPKSPEVITKPMEKMPAETPAEPSAFTVNGEAVSQKEFDKAFEDSLAQQRQLYKQFGQDFDKMLQGAEGAYMKLRLKGEAAENLIQKKINAQAAKKYGVSVSDTQVDDRFKKEYQRVLDFYKQRNGWAEKDIEEKLKEQKSSLDEFKKQIRAFVVDTLKQEALQAAVSGEIELNDVEVLAFIEKDPSRYSQEIVKPFNPIDAELKAFWGKHPDQFGQSRVHVRHILIRVAQDAPDEVVKAAQAKIAEVQKKLSDGADFGELAKAYSEDPGTKDRGGDLGFVDEKTPFIKEFKDVALKLQAGQLSEPVRTRFGFHLIKADAREDLTLEQLRPQLKEAFQEAKQTELVNDWITRAKAGKTGRELTHARFILVAQTESQKVGELLKNAEDFDKLVKAYSKDGATVDEGGDLGWFSVGRFGPEFDDAVSKLEIGHVSGVFATPLGELVVKLEARESEKTFEQVRELVKEDFLSAEREDRFKKWYDKTRTQAQINFQDPLLTAYSLEHDNKIEDALASYQKLLDDKTLKDPYVAYYIARIYQNKITQAQKQHKDLEKQSDKKTELEALDKQIADYKVNA